MSEFSESYHLRATSRKEAVHLLQSAGLAGFVFPSIDGWVTLVAEGEPFSLNEELIAANTSVLLRWVFGEDHGWEFSIHRGQRPLCNYSCSWEEELSIKGDLSCTDLEKFLGISLPTLESGAAQRVLTPASIEEVFTVRPAYTFATAIGLTNFRWLSYEHLAVDHARGNPLPAGVLAV